MEPTTSSLAQARRSLALVVIALISVGTLLSTRIDSSVLMHVVLFGCPLAVGLLAAARRPSEGPSGRLVLGVVAGIAFGQLLSLVLGPRVVDVPTFDALSFFFLTFGVPVIVVLCLAAIVLGPVEEHDDEHDDEHVDGDPTQDPTHD
ncbi:hypothetical protein GCM10009821_21350 [Aeromicrobium halocynthiae]|uniref:Uncharacterized protein n=1 Tax=Aeromicrobium halocynthiae TaxID=560557 RepID=A0ABN2W1P0_9ACTN